MKKIVLLSSLLLLIITHPAYSTGKGPLLTRNSYPSLLLFLQIPNDASFRPEKNSGYTETLLSHSNVFSGKQTEKGSVSFDMEVTRLSNRWIYGAADNLTVGIELPFLYLWRGFTDAPLQEFHKILGLPNQNRENGVDYTYAYLINIGQDQLENRGEDVFGIGDVSCFMTYRFTDKQKFFPYVGLISAIKFPSGDVTLHHGSGKFDFGIGLAIEKPVNKFNIYSVTGIVYPGNPDFFDDIEIKPFLTESLSLEYIYFENLSLIGQIDFNSNPYSSGISKLDQESMELLLGIKRSFSNKTLLNISITENLTAETIVDYTLQIGIGKKF